MVTVPALSRAISRNAPNQQDCMVEQNGFEPSTPTKIIDGADHFFGGYEEELTALDTILAAM
jgi:hypothetical protein